MSAYSDRFGGGSLGVIPGKLIDFLDGDLPSAHVLARIEWRCDPEFSRTGWWRVSIRELAREVHLSVDRVQLALEKLRDAGYVMAELRNANPLDRTLSYQVSIPAEESICDEPAYGEVIDDDGLAEYEKEFPGVPDEEVVVPDSMLPGFDDLPERVIHSGASQGPSWASPTSSSVTSKNKTLRTTALSTSFLDADFAEWWAVYPRRDDKKKARTAYARARQDVGREVLLAGAAAYRDDPNRQRQYTKLPTTWLNAGSWDNEPLPSQIEPSRNTRVIAASAARLGVRW